MALMECSSLDITATMGAPQRGKTLIGGDCVQNVPCSAVLFTACCYRVSVVFAWYDYYVKEYQCFSYSMIVSWKKSTSHWVKSCRS